MIMNLSPGAMRHNHGGSLNFDDCHFDLLRDVLMAQKDGKWFAVEPIPGALVCIGFEGAQQSLILAAKNNQKATNKVCDLLIHAEVLPSLQNSSLPQSIPVRNLVAWNSIIGGYARDGLAERAIQEFERMLMSGISPDEITFINLVYARNSNFSFCISNSAATEKSFLIS
ncbi:hypothetical protein FXO38_14002 [Capsicum annuum]|nr:hypothetical protein FXO38_14002 [Capsicum annuum]